MKISIKQKITKMFTSDLIDLKNAFIKSFFNIFKFDVETFSWKFLSSTILRWIAVVTMFIDHFGYIVYPELEWLRIVGRIAFPIFAFLSIIAINNSSRPLYYVLRFLFLAVAIQLVILILSKFNAVSGLRPQYLNIMFILFLGVFSAYLHRKNLYLGIIVSLAIFVCLFAFEFNISKLSSLNYLFNIDYQSYGYAIIIFGFYCYLVASKLKYKEILFKIFFILGFIIINFVWVYLFKLMPEIQIYSLVTCFLFALYSFEKPHKFWLFNWIFLSAYPLSFIIPGIVAFMIN
ncbi:TraX family protein [Mycoplasma procyoni]|uniref:TraX family protein n=1 Tax=Mycoplasma procyoni TaxID=568784 RepID=UPI00197C2394|nr:TraX family protein [Mycoplasma procyoni]MBN3534389.1 hypothetical protein [Mycoplasma procyoni]